MELDSEKLGQVFTEDRIVKQMLEMMRNDGSILEPSCGDGAFLNILPDHAVGIEFDSKVAPPRSLNMDFFDYGTDNKFDTIIGNPPYVKYKNILPETKQKLDLTNFDERSNLYLFFIEKCINHLADNGELIFIVPRDFIKSTSAIKMNKMLYEAGTITDWIEFGDEIIFKGFYPNCAIFRFEKNNFSRITNNHLNFVESDGQLLFIEGDANYKFSDYFFVKVGGVSGKDFIFDSANGNMNFVYSKTIDTGETKTMHYNQIHPELVVHKDELISRKIKKFNENNWYMWGRDFYKSSSPRIYVNTKTRRDRPFFIHDCLSYDGSVMAVFPKFEITDDTHLQFVCDYLNEIDWDALGFKVGGRFIFNQKSLENSILTRPPE